MFFRHVTAHFNRFLFRNCWASLGQTVILLWQKTTVNSLLPKKKKPFLNYSNQKKKNNALFTLPFKSVGSVKK